ncbi:hypothetical protein A9Q81_08740 [Gammaproteobacteria bacterium 42_54_T18]|nr:hypothetical protein A9Q81_08740 [Gammaproteobacteria bacterium 42_54_T18]
MFHRMRQFFRRYFSVNAVVLWVLNKALPSQWGRVTNVDIDRDSSDVSLTLDDGELSTELMLCGYKIEMVGDGQARLHWRKVVVQGGNKAALQGYFKDRSSMLIPIPSRFVVLVEMLGRNKLKSV